MSDRPKCDIRCGCICHDSGGNDAMHIPGLKGCPGKHGYIMNNRGEWIKESTMTTNRINQLAEWWENAEDAPPSPGDHIIERHVCERDEDTYYTVGVHREGMRGLIGKSGTRILSRAPKPAWHDALAVVAECKHDAPDRGRGTFINDRSGQWLDESGERYVSSDLTDVTPLVKAEVTDEMVGRALDVADRHEAAVINTRIMREALTAALGLETE